MKPHYRFAIVASLIAVVGVATTVAWVRLASPVKSTPEVVFEAPKKDILECERAADGALRCTDAERGVTCYVTQPQFSAASATISCLPNKWLNYPQSAANVNAENF